MLNLGRLLLLVGCVWSLVVSVDIPNHRYGYVATWYAGYVWFSDWRTVPVCNAATNVAVHNWYTGGRASSYRPLDIAGFMERIERGETLRVGVDYHALNISRSIIPQQILEDYGRYLIQGGVLVLTATKGKSGVVFTPQRRTY